MNRTGHKLAIRYAKWVFTFALGINAAGCFADNKATPAGWRTDCVGRMELTLPGDAATQSDSSQALRARGLRQSEYDYSHGAFSFDDDERGWTELTEGVVSAVSPPLTPKQIDVLKKADAKQRQTNFAEYTKLAAARGETYESVMVDTGTPRATAHRSKTGVGLFIELGDRVVMAGYRLNAGDFVHDKTVVPQLITNIRAREVFDVPAEPGLCYPHVFVKDDSNRRRQIAVDYRSKARPDFHVVLWDATAYNPDKEGINPEDETSRRNTWRNKEPDRQIGFFWGQRRFEGDTLPEWSTVTKRVEMDGRTGLQSFIRLQRPNGTVDYEYYAVVRGDPKAKEDTPDLALYVYTSNDYGKKKGLAPIAKEEFIKMAQSVAASVKRRPVIGK